MSDTEEGSQISDIDKAWTAAKAENLYRQKAERKFGKHPGPIAEKVIAEGADEAGEARIRDYSPDEEASLESLKRKAEELIFRCEFFLKQKFGDLENARKQLKNDSLGQSKAQELTHLSYQALLASIDDLTIAMREIDYDKGKRMSNYTAGILDPRQQILQSEKNIEFALDSIRMAKESL